ncbi:MAG: hypothetical protein QOE90_2801 [Thermoplasmata archaeon]|jgi:hypothetical protein|nr:hypothetical protein [Thermoplasmata archaeon]
MTDFECFCGEGFETRDDLIQHNVQEHDMSETESESRVMEKYPVGGP